MQIGIDSFVATLADPGTGALLDPSRRITNLLQEIELADQVGLDVFGIGEHHREEFLDSAPAILLAAAAARTRRIRLASAVTVLSAHDRYASSRTLPPLTSFPEDARRSSRAAGRSSKRIPSSAWISATTTPSSRRNSTSCSRSGTTPTCTGREGTALRSRDKPSTRVLSKSRCRSGLGRAEPPRRSSGRVLSACH
jgi:hypothetical protein